MESYEPEMGQMLFGQPYKECAVPDIMEAALVSIGNELDRVMGNLTQRDFASPFENNGASFRCPTFTAVAYSWSEEPQPYNFKHARTGLTISWYKYLGRGMSADRKISPDMASEVLADCLAACRRIEKGEESYDDPGIYPEVVSEPIA